ncbi:hypothetical protein KXD40_005191 [Peronospora effusa]|nr:hypothetical protein KXD40_005191 [Peronospora effusa]
MPYTRRIFAWGSQLFMCGSAGLTLTLTASALSYLDIHKPGRSESIRSHHQSPRKPMMFVRDAESGRNSPPIDWTHSWLLRTLTILLLLPTKKRRALSTHRILMESEAMGPQAETIARKIFEKYYPIEQSATLTRKEKLPFMIQWWTETHELIVKHGVSKKAVCKAVEESDITFREGFMEIFELLARENVPVLIFSAGLYDVIHAVLNKEYAKTIAKMPPKNVHVISNMMRFDENDKVVGFDGTLIHSLNKNASALVETDFWKQCQLEKRHNILLLGDSLGDSNMANGLDFKEDEIVRIGFLNDGIEQKLDMYLQRFDVVLTNDSGLLPVELLLHQIQL